MMPALDSVAWASRWRMRSVAEKTVLCGGLLLCAVILPPWPAALLVLVAVFVADRIAGSPPAHLLSMLCIPLLFIITAATATAFTVDPAGPRLTTSGPAVLTALGTAARSLSATAAMILLASTTPMTEFTASLRRIGLPPACVDLVTAMYRLIFLLLDSLAVVRKSQVSRLGYSSVRRSVRSAGLLTAAVLVRAWSRGHAVDRGLTCRAVGGAATTRPAAPPVSGGFLLAALVTVVVIVTTSTFIAAAKG